MNLIIGGDTPANVREYAKQFVEALLTFWIARFGMNQDILPTLTIEVMTMLEEFLSHPNADAPTSSETPLSLAMKLSQDKFLDRFLLTGKPVTAEDLAEAARIATIATAAANWMTSEIDRRLLEQLVDDEPGA